MIVDDIGSGETKGPKRCFNVLNPQIVNGCQTVSTIFESLDSLPASSLEDEFKDTYVMVKILKIPPKDDKLKELYRNIVTYNNSQNSINEKSFVANNEVFKRRSYPVCQ